MRAGGKFSLASLINRRVSLVMVHQLPEGPKGVKEDKGKVVLGSTPEEGSRGEAGPGSGTSCERDDWVWECNREDWPVWLEEGGHFPFDGPKEAFGVATWSKGLKEDPGGLLYVMGYGNPHDNAGEVHGPSGPQTSSGPDPRIYPHQVYGGDVGASVAMVNAWNPVVRGDVRPGVSPGEVALKARNSHGVQTMQQEVLHQRSFTVIQGGQAGTDKDIPQIFIPPVGQNNVEPIKRVTST
ncbi:unnamed protein product [Gadus morhua 'NCC']